jgi:hypothetical protein
VFGLKLEAAMKKKPSPASRLFVSNPGPHNTALNWNNGPEREFPFYARAFHKAAKTLVANEDLDRMARSDWDACPVVFLYRHALELHLKALVLGDGSNFLASQPDPASIYRTHSLHRLAQFVCQIVTAVKWEKEFKCEGVEALADFKAVIGELELVDPGSPAFRYPVNTEGQGSVPSHLTFSVLEVAAKMDAVLELLDSTTDALAATWDMQVDGLALEVGPDDGSDFGPTIQ